MARCQSCHMFEATKRVIGADGKRRWRCDSCLERRRMQLRKKAKAPPRPPGA